MAESEKKKRVLKQGETMRQRTEKAADGKNVRRLHTSTSKVSASLGSVTKTGKKEFYLPLPDNKLGRFLNKRRRLVPRYFSESWQELRQVAWPTRRETLKMTLAVFIFSVLLSLIITIIDYGLDKVFRKVFLS